MSDWAQASGMVMLLLLASLIVVIIAIISLGRSVCLIFASRDGRLQRSLDIGRIAARRTFLSVVIVAVLGYGWSYYRNAHLRSICAEKDRSSEWSVDGVYAARYCYFKDTIVLRLYDRRGQRLVAERTYRDTSGDPVRIYWEKSVLLYAEDYDFGRINLPPSLYDRLLAKLP